MIHQYKNNGYNIVLDVNSGMVHVVDDLVYDIIAMYETASKEEIMDEMLNKYSDAKLAEAIGGNITKEDVEQAIADIEQLKADGNLFFG